MPPNDHGSRGIYRVLARTLRWILTVSCNYSIVVSTYIITGLQGLWSATKASQATQSLCTILRHMEPKCIESSASIANDSRSNETLVDCRDTRKSSRPKGLGMDPCWQGQSMPCADGGTRRHRDIVRPDEYKRPDDTDFE